ncbi:hypothetical protein HYDPIDRAFT_120489, partial [Hydnomerulius pinastri MD-312]
MDHAEQRYNVTVVKLSPYLELSLNRLNGPELRDSNVRAVCFSRSSLLPSNQLRPRLLHVFE